MQISKLSKMLQGAAYKKFFLAKCERTMEF
jgi:hypothetical protein